MPEEDVLVQYVFRWMDDVLEDTRDVGEKNKETVWEILERARNHYLNISERFEKLKKNRQNVPLKELLQTLGDVLTEPNILESSDTLIAQGNRVHKYIAEEREKLKVSLFKNDRREFLFESNGIGEQRKSASSAVVESADGGRQQRLWLRHILLLTDDEQLQDMLTILDNAQKKGRINQSRVRLLTYSFNHRVSSYKDLDEPMARELDVTPEYVSLLLFGHTINGSSSNGVYVDLYQLFPDDIQQELKEYLAKHIREKLYLFLQEFLAPEDIQRRVKKSKRVTGLSLRQKRYLNQYILRKKIISLSKVARQEKVSLINTVVPEFKHIADAVAGLAQHGGWWSQRMGEVVDRHAERVLKYFCGDLEGWPIRISSYIKKIAGAGEKESMICERIFDGLSYEALARKYKKSKTQVRRFFEGRSENAVYAPGAINLFRSFLAEDLSRAAGEAFKEFSSDGASQEVWQKAVENILRLGSIYQISFEWYLAVDNESGRSVYASTLGPAVDTVQSLAANYKDITLFGPINLLKQVWISDMDREIYPRACEWCKRHGHTKEMIAVRLTERGIVVTIFLQNRSAVYYTHALEPPVLPGSLLILPEEWESKHLMAVYDTADRPSRTGWPRKKSLLGIFTDKNDFKDSCPATGTIQKCLIVGKTTKKGWLRFFPVKRRFKNKAYSGVLTERLEDISCRLQTLRIFSLSDGRFLRKSFLVDMAHPKGKRLPDADTLTQQCSMETPEDILSKIDVWLEYLVDQANFFLRNGEDRNVAGWLEAQLKQGVAFTKQIENTQDIPNQKNVAVIIKKITHSLADISKDTPQEISNGFVNFMDEMHSLSGKINKHFYVSLNLPKKRQAKRQQHLTGPSPGDSVTFYSSEGRSSSPLNNPYSAVKGEAVAVMAEESAETVKIKKADVRSEKPSVEKSWLEHLVLCFDWDELSGLIDQALKRKFIRSPKSAEALKLILKELKEIFSAATQNQDTEILNKAIQQSAQGEDVRGLLGVHFKWEDLYQSVGRQLGVKGNRIANMLFGHVMSGRFFSGVYEEIYRKVPDGIRKEFVPELQYFFSKNLSTVALLWEFFDSPENRANAWELLNGEGVTIKYWTKNQPKLLRILLQRKEQSLGGEYSTTELTNDAGITDRRNVIKSLKSLAKKLADTICRTEEGRKQLEKMAMRHEPEAIKYLIGNLDHFYDALTSVIDEGSLDIKDLGLSDQDREDMIKAHLFGGESFGLLGRKYERDERTVSRFFNGLQRKSQTYYEGSVFGFGCFLSSRLTKESSDLAQSLSSHNKASLDWRKVVKIILEWRRRFAVAFTGLYLGVSHKEQKIVFVSTSCPGREKIVELMRRYQDVMLFGSQRILNRIWVSDLDRAAGAAMADFLRLHDRQDEWSMMDLSSRGLFQIILPESGYTAQMTHTLRVFPRERGSLRLDPKWQHKVLMMVYSIDQRTVSAMHIPQKTGVVGIFANRGGFRGLSASYLVSASVTETGSLRFNGKSRGNVSVVSGAWTEMYNDPQGRLKAVRIFHGPQGGFREYGLIDKMKHSELYPKAAFVQRVIRWLEQVLEETGDGQGENGVAFRALIDQTYYEQFKSMQKQTDILKPGTREYKLISKFLHNFGKLVGDRIPRVDAVQNFLKRNLPSLKKSLFENAQEVNGHQLESKQELSGKGGGRGIRISKDRTSSKKHSSSAVAGEGDKDKQRSVWINGEEIQLCTKYPDGIEVYIDMEAVFFVGQPRLWIRGLNDSQGRSWYQRTDERLGRLRYEFFSPDMMNLDALRGKTVVVMCCGGGTAVKEMRRYGINAFGLDIALNITQRQEMLHDTSLANPEHKRIMQLPT
ncbi:MAG: hypothetical protein MJA29_02065, partial [Candidatus Omnitrophica bacterium]|nr:hypothetical protein [Candidatus Omnitrophota bacterium]